MVTIAWNPTGFAVICVLSRGCKFNSRAPQRETLGPLIVHADDARLPATTVSQEFMEDNGIQELLIHLTHRVGHPLTLICSAM
jgi:hypothetical protein